MVTLFDTTGTMVAVTTQAGLVKNGRMERAKEALLADSFASLAASLFGSFKYFCTIFSAFLR